MTDPLLTNEMKRYAVIVSLKVDHGNLEITRFSELQDLLPTRYVKS